MATSWTNESLNTTSWTNESLHSTDWGLLSFMLQEIEDFLLLETGDKIVLKRGTTLNSTSWTNLTKH